MKYINPPMVVDKMEVFNSSKCPDGLFYMVFRDGGMYNERRNYKGGKRKDNKMIDLFMQAKRKFL